MSLLSQVTHGKRQQPRRILLYGTHGIGKSTFGAMAERPIFVPTEDGQADIDCSSFPLCNTYDEFLACLTELYSGQHEYKTVVIDSADWLERLIWANVAKRSNVENIAKIDYQRGYDYALTEWREVLTGLNAIRDARGMTVILLAHAKVEKFANPETDSYDRYSPRLHKAASYVIQEWCDEVLFATYKVFTKANDEGFNKTRTQGVGSGERVIRTTERPAHLAKNRLTLPPELPLDWTEFAKYLPQPTIAA